MPKKKWVGKNHKDSKHTVNVNHPTTNDAHNSQSSSATGIKAPPIPSSSPAEGYFAHLKNRVKKFIALEASEQKLKDEQKKLEDEQKKLEDEQKRQDADRKQFVDQKAKDAETEQHKKMQEAQREQEQKARETRREQELKAEKDKIDKWAAELKMSEVDLNKKIEEAAQQKYKKLLEDKEKLEEKIVHLKSDINEITSNLKLKRQSYELSVEFYEAQIKTYKSTMETLQSSLEILKDHITGRNQAVDQLKERMVTLDVVLATTREASKAASENYARLLSTVSDMAARPQIINHGIMAEGPVTIIGPGSNNTSTSSDSKFALDSSHRDVVLTDISQHSVNQFMTAVGSNSQVLSAAGVPLELSPTNKDRIHSKFFPAAHGKPSDGKAKSPSPSVMHVLRPKGKSLLNL